MKGRLDLMLAERRGSRIADEHGFANVPVDPLQIAGARGITVQSKPLTGCAGCLVRQGDLFGILYSSGLANQGMVNFTVAHELGHYFLEGHTEALFTEGVMIHQSQGAFRSADPREREADHFAVGLLMPEQPFLEALRTAGEGLNAVETLAERCGTSLTATAIRYAALSEDPVAIIVATGQKVDFCFLSEPLRGVRGLEWLKKGSQVPSGTATAKLAAKPDDIQRAVRATGGCAFSDWLDGAPDSDCNEDVVGLGRFEQTLTVLWSDEPINEDEDEGESDDGS